MGEHTMKVTTTTTTTTPREALPLRRGIIQGREGRHVRRGSRGRGRNSCLCPRSATPRSSSSSSSCPSSSYELGKRAQPLPSSLSLSFSSQEKRTSLVACKSSSSFQPNGVGKVIFNNSKQQKSSSSFLKDFLAKGKGLDRKKLASLGASVLLSYGFVSNVNACTLVTIAWIICGRTTGLSPLAAGNWKAFLGIYGGLYLSFGNLLRPIRASLAIFISPV